MTNYPPLVIEPPSPAQSAIIWMHGLGADAHDFEGIVPMLPVRERATRMIFPNAPIRPVTINMGMEMPAWYDISDVALRNADKQGIAESLEIITQLIDEQIEQGITADKIVVAGFSQGGAMALHAGLRYPQRLAGIVALSCYLLERDEHKQQVSEENIDTPIWMAHGLQDSVVSYDLGESSAALLTHYEHPVTFISYPMGHEVMMSEISDLSEWLSGILA